MTNLELFKLLNKEQQLEVVKTLSAYKECHITYYNGEYHIETSYYLLANYPADFKVFDNTFKNTEFFKDVMWYHNAWYNYIEQRKANGEKNEPIVVNGKRTAKFQYEFETQFAEPIYQEALNKYLAEEDE